MSKVEHVSLGELLRLERRPVVVATEDQYAEIGIYCFGRGIFHKMPRSGLEVGNKDLFIIKEGDFILQVTFAWEGAVALASAAEDGMFGSTRFPTFRVDENRCSAPFLVNYFKTPEGRDQLVKISPGSAGRNRVLSLKRIPEVIVPLPSLGEQRRIVARIEELAAKIEEVRSLRRQTVEEAEALCRSIVFGCTNAVLTPMHELVRPRGHTVEVKPDKSYHFAGVYCFGRGIFRGQKKTGMDFAYKQLGQLKAGNFVYPKLMAWEGALGVVPQECDGLFVSPEFPIFEVLENRVLPETLDVYFRTPSVWPLLAGESTGTNVRRRRLNPKDFLAYKIPLPSMRTQLLLRQVMQKVEVLKRIQAETAIEIDAMLPSILDRAFCGALLQNSF